ncbi:High-affinity nickel-transport protein [Halogranum gelatinilyticum]|uniref:Nickel/cobalt efflux system n=1 Tax=Halogranum gelatinilyticum TaxID=660521 RepID=A0A1G9XHD6_9EURY|nr:hypothetical protein [Halogranum gelatinilyticum]SDM96140.1 High-affinity nickel-transport protein [Halogranum gelatinilyticum]
MSAESVGVALATAGLLGVTHAIEPDHVAGISSLTSRYGDARLSALVGACFSLGHAAVVVVWVGLAYLVLGSTSFPPILDTVGTTAAGVILGLFGAMMAVSGLRAAVYEHDHGGESHSHVHVGLPFFGTTDHDSHAEHDRSVRAYLKTGLVGALFTLSPPLSMLAFTSTLLPQFDGGVVGLAVTTYAVSITVAMSLIGAGAGAVFGLTQGRGVRAFGAVQTVAGVGVVALAATMVLGAVGTPF